MATIEGYSLAPFSTEEVQPEIDRTDLAALVQTHSGLLFRVAQSILRSPSEAEDVVQDVFIRVLKHRHSLHSITNTRVWLIRIAWNLAIDRKRRIQPEQIDELFAQSLVTSDIPADQAYDQAQRMTSVLREIERLPKRERHVLLLSAIDELGTAEMAQVLGRSESAVRALLFRARTRLRERLEKNEGSR